MSKIEVPDKMSEDEAEQILQRANKKPKESTKNKAGGDDSGAGGLLLGLLALVLWALSEFAGVSFF